MKDGGGIKRILAALDAAYPWDERCFLHYEKPWQLLFATILSAQCTDDRVNMVTEGLYAKFPELRDFAEADIAELEAAIMPVGYFHAKAAHIKRSASMLLGEFGGEVPATVEELTRLQGVGRKTANVLLSHIYKKPCIVVDTHVKRIANRLGLTGFADPVKIEFDLMKKLPEKNWIGLNYQLITLGRAVCLARKPKCGACPLAPECEFEAKRN
ncbi:MAG: endonuclease III [Defluviitaleaceae bacterium]|nr:endonuclease III [Defluviitaleaceae bacterium]